MNKHLLYYYLIKYESNELLRLIDDWFQYNNPNMEKVIDFILANSEELTDEFFDRFIEILDKYGKTEYALKCVRKIIEDRKKERFEL